MKAKEKLTFVKINIDAEAVNAPLYSVITVDLRAGKRFAIWKREKKKNADFNDHFLRASIFLDCYLYVMHTDSCGTNF